MKRLAVGFLSMVLLAPGLIGAQGRSAEQAEPAPLPAGGSYRYQRPDGQMVMTHTLPQEAIVQGYEVLNRTGRVVKTVDPAPTEEDRARWREEDQARSSAQEQRRRDAELQRLYTGPEDAVRARDRQVEALRLNIDYARNNIQQVKSQLDEEIAAAARFERAGRPIPDGVEENIARFTRQVSELEEEIVQYQQDIDVVEENFAPIISRLRELSERREGREQRQRP